MKVDMVELIEELNESLSEEQQTEMYFTLITSGFSDIINLNGFDICYEITVYDSESYTVPEEFEDVDIPEKDLIKIIINNNLDEIKKSLTMLKIK